MTNGKTMLGIAGLAIGSAVGGALNFGIYGTLREKQWNPWAAGAVVGGVGAVIAVGLGLAAAKLGKAATDTGALPPSHSLRILSKGLTSAAVGQMGPGIPRLGPVSVGAYTATPLGAYSAQQVGAYAAERVSGCAGCR